MSSKKSPNRGIAKQDLQFVDSCEKNMKFFNVFFTDGGLLSQLGLF